MESEIDMMVNHDILPYTKKLNIPFLDYFCVKSETQRSRDSCGFNAITQVFHIFLNLDKEFRFRLYSIVQIFKDKYSDRQASKLIKSIMDVFIEFEKI